MGSCNLFVDGGDSLSLGASLRGKQTITSKNGTFALGFFNPNGTNNWYIGIWYTQIPDKTIVWVANRETPITDMPGVFTLSSTGYLTVSDLQGKVMWSSNKTQQTKASRASILDNGNFVLLGAQNISEIVWESFANPTDTVLPTVKFWKGLKVNSWKSSMDPAPGPFFAQINPSPGKTDVLLQYKNGVSYYSTGEWNGSYFATLPGSPASSIVKEEFKVFSSTRMYYSFKVAPQAGMMMVRVNWKGELSVYHWINNGWNVNWYQPQLRGSVYGMFGTYGVCSTQEISQPCRCAEGFHPRDATAWRSQEWWSSGCVRRTPLQCFAINGSGSDTTDGFLQISNYTLSDQEAIQNTPESTLLVCKTACLNNCSCTAFAFADSNCKLWFGDLLSMRTKATSSGGQPLFIRLAASDASQLSAHAGRSSSRVLVLSISIPLGVAILGILFIGAWLFIQRRRKRLLQNVENFGMTLLEIISGRRNSDLSVQESQCYFPTWAAAQILKGNTMGLVDERIADMADVEEVRRAAMVSILCIQKDENGRPSMAQVVRILEGKSEGDVEQYERSLQRWSMIIQ
ncbi:hypothetical protein SUGI_0664310 [Cryptomeria japonica]|nr:hypothetical protein SUGI_0664310 [Cryptomeria japonica]